MFTPIDDKIRPFIEEKMRQIDAVYNDDDFDVYFLNTHLNLVCIKNNHIIAFCCIITYQDLNSICYTWCDKSIEGKKAYLYGLKHFPKDYNMVYKIDSYYPKAVKKRVS